MLKTGWHTWLQQAPYKKPCSDEGGRKSQLKKTLIQRLLRKEMGMPVVGQVERKVTCTAELVEVFHTAIVITSLKYQSRKISVFMTIKNF
jgi:hypothetical protein